MTRADIYCGDSFALLPSSGVICDVLLTDPPYDENVHSTMARKGTLTNGVLGKVDPCFAALASLDFVPRFCSLAKRWAMFFCALEQLGPYRDAHPSEWIRSGIYAKGKAMPQITGDRPGNRCEGIAIFHPKGRKVWNGGGTAALWTAQPESRKHTLHPTAKPRLLAMRIIELMTNAGETILDPFAGTGNIGIAAKALGRHYVGIELDPVHAGNAAARIAAEDYGALRDKYSAYRERFTGPGNGLIEEIIE